MTTIEPRLAPFREKLIFPLDFPNKTEALRFALELSPCVGWFKVGLELFIAEGPEILGELKKSAPHCKIFLDLKLHDIPATVGKAVSRAKHLGAQLLTLHAQGGAEMIKAAALNCGQMNLLAVTVLTSLNLTDFPELAKSVTSMGDWALKLAQRSLAAGCRGLVASPAEIVQFRKVLGPEVLLVIPGIRPQNSDIPNDDQKRTGTPGQAIKDGASLLVIGRPISQAKDPKSAALNILEQMAGGI
jgi:orotidine-5'-phosphate decarboxylase